MVIGPRDKALASDMKHHLGLSYAKVAPFFNGAFGLAVVWVGADCSVRTCAWRPEPAQYTTS